MAAETQYTANTGLVQISSANTSLTGSGTLGTDIYTLITGASNGTLVKSVTVKSTGTTSEGMVRIFMYDGTNTNLIQEINIPANAPSATNPAFEFTWKCDFILKATHTLRVTTQVANTFNIAADGLDWTYFSSAVRPESTNFTAQTGSAVLTTANTSLTGSGTLNTDIWSVISASNGGISWNGLRMDTITVKARVTTTMGMVRLFLYDGTNTRLFKEIPVPAITQSATEKTFEARIDLGGINLKTNWEIRATTEKSEAIVVSIEGQLWKYPAASTIANFTPASGTAVTTEELLHSLAVPAGLFSTGDVMRVCATFVMVGSGSKNFRIYVNTSSSLSGATKLGTVTFTTETSGSIMRLFPVISATSMGAFGGATQSVISQYAANAGTTSNITVPTTASAFYVIISGQKGTSGDTDTVQWSVVQKDNTYSL